MHIPLSTLILFAQIFLGYEISQTEWKMNDVLKEVRYLQMKVKEIEVKPQVYVIVETKDPAKYCKKDVEWCYAVGEKLKCSKDRKDLPNDVTHLKICTQ